MGQAFSNFSDEKLREMAVTGDRQAEEALFLRYSRLVRVCARPLFLVGGDGEDLIQEGMLGLLDAVREFDPGRDVLLRPFAEVCIRNRLRSAIRSAGREKHLPLNTSVSLESEEAAEMETPASPEELMIARETRREDLDRLMRRLSPLEGRVLRLYLRGLSYGEIAASLHRSEKSVDNAVQRIRHKLGRSDCGESSAS